MGTLHANRASYETKSLSFTGLPQHGNDEEVPGETICTFTLDVIESGIHDLRSYIAGSTGAGFSGAVQHGDVQFDFAAAHLALPLSEPSYGSNRAMRVVFDVQRDFITHLRRPIGQTVPDPSVAFFQALLVLGTDRDLWRRRRIELERAYADLDTKRQEVEAAEAGIESRRVALFERGEAEWVAQARQRGWE